MFSRRRLIRAYCAKSDKNIPKFAKYSQTCNIKFVIMLCFKTNFHITLPHSITFDEINMQMYEVAKLSVYDHDYYTTELVSA